MEYRVGEDSSYAEVAEESILIARKRNVGIARRDSHLFELLAMRTRESDEELRSKYANAPKSDSKSNGAEPKKPK